MKSGTAGLRESGLHEVLSESTPLQGAPFHTIVRPVSGHGIAHSVVEGFLGSLQLVAWALQTENLKPMGHGKQKVSC